MKELKEVLKELKAKNISVLDLEIMQEIQFQQDYSTREFTEEETEKIFNIVSRAYLKSDNTKIEQLTAAVINNLANVDTMNTWDLIEESYNY